MRPDRIKKVGSNLKLIDHEIPKVEKRLYLKIRDCKMIY